MRRFGIVTGLFAVVLTLLAAPAFAQEAIDAQMFRPSIFNGHFLAIEDARTLDKLCYGFGLYANYASSVVEVRVDDKFDSGILNSVTSANLTAAFSPWRWLSLGVDVPFHLQSRAKSFEDVEKDPDAGEDPGDTPLEDNATLGDIKAELKLGVFNEERNKTLGLALAGFATFPTGDPNIFLGEGTTNFGGKLMLEKDFRVFNIGLNGGYLVRPTRTVFGTDIGNAYLFGAGLSRDFKNGLGFSIEWWGQQFDSSSNEQLQANPMEVIGTLRYKFGKNGPRLIGGAGAGLTSGVGSPSYRVIAGIDYYPRCEGPTQGKLNVRVVSEDGKPVVATLTVAGPKTTDPKTPSKTFKTPTDEGGDYRAMMDPGEYAIVATANGYNPKSGKGLVVIGKTTEVVIALEMKKQPTTLTINVVYKKDQKPIDGAAILIKNTASGKVEAAKAIKGKWENKYDAGNIVVSSWAQGYERVDQPFEVVANKANVLTIELRQIIIKIGSIRFDYDSANLRPESIPVLQDVIRQIKLKEAEGGYKKLIIEGHTSAEGTDEYNLNLSQKRAASVAKFLAENGIKAELLEPIGYGESRPIAENETDEGKEQNRRVEFIFEE